MSLKGKSSKNVLDRQSSKGDRKEPGKSTLKKHPTIFQMRVYDCIRMHVPKGYVTSYGVVAKAVGSSARAVGQALRVNPYAPDVPCHRVITNGLTLGGFRGSCGAKGNVSDLLAKESLLKEEGVVFSSRDGRLLSKECFLKRIEYYT